VFDVIDAISMGYDKLHAPAQSARFLASESTIDRTLRNVLERTIVAFPRVTALYFFAHWAFAELDRPASPKREPVLVPNL